MVVPCERRTQTKTRITESGKVWILCFEIRIYLPFSVNRHAPLRKSELQNRFSSLIRVHLLLIEH